MIAKEVLFFPMVMLRHYFFPEEPIPRTQVERRKTSPYFSSKYSKEGTVLPRETDPALGEGTGWLRTRCVRKCSQFQAGHTQWQQGSAFVIEGGPLPREHTWHTGPCGQPQCCASAAVRVFPHSSAKGSVRVTLLHPHALPHCAEPAAQVHFCNYFPFSR